jgi:lipopolysaccharide transport system ATP-binding protein
MGEAAPEGAAGSAKFLDIRISVDGEEGKLLEITPGRSVVRIEAEFAYDPKLELPTLAFGLETPSGLAVSSGSTAFDGVNAEVTGEGRARAVLTFPDIALMRGTYRLTLFLGCENSILVYDQALYCAEFVVQSDRVEQGICYLKRQWNDGPRIEVNP